MALYFAEQIQTARYLLNLTFIKSNISLVHFIFLHDIMKLVFKRPRKNTYFNSKKIIMLSIYQCIFSMSYERKVEQGNEFCKSNIGFSRI